MRFVLVNILFFFSATLLGQEVISSDNIADLKGAVEIEQDRTYSIDFTGNWGWNKDFANSPLSNEFSEKNPIFLIKRCYSDNELNFHLTYGKPTLQLAIFKFKHKADNTVPALNEMQLIYLSKELQSSYTSFEDDISDYKVPKFVCDKGESFLIVINNTKKTNDRLSLALKGNEEEDEDANPIKIFDDRLPEDLTNIHISIRDKETHLPVKAKINVSTKKRTSLYDATDVILGQDSKTKVQIICDAEGYFFKDTLANFNQTTNDTIVIYMQSISVGKVFKINNIEFIRGTANLVPGAENILKRVKDFLILNSGVRIEIQGHVNSEGGGDKAAVKLSKKRALTIKKYFLRAGIYKDRMIHKGFGSQYPIYPSPKNEYEQQANRRVEIKIID